MAVRRPAPWRSSSPTLTSSIGSDPDRALFTLAIVTGAMMVAAGVFRLGALLRFVSNAVTVGFISAVGLNIVLGQWPAFTGYAAAGRIG